MMADDLIVIVSVVAVVALVLVLFYGLLWVTRGAKSLLDDSGKRGYRGFYRKDDNYNDLIDGGW